MKWINKLTIAALSTVVANIAVAQVDLDATDASGGPGSDVDVFINVTGDGSTVSPSWRLLYPIANFSAVDASQCGVSSPDISGDTNVSCGNSCGGFVPPSGFSCVSYILAPTDNFNPQPVADTQLGPITFTLDSGLTAGTSFDLTFADTDLVGSTNPSTIVVAVPAGQSFFASNPDIGQTINFGPVPVNSTSAAAIITVDNLQDDGSSTFDILGTTGGTADVGSSATIAVTSPASFPATVNADGSGGQTVDVAFTCTPEAEGEQTGTLTIANDADNPAGAEEYPFTCFGTAPDVQVSPLTLNLNGNVGGTNPTGSVTVTNAGAADATSATVVIQSDATEITQTADGLENATITPGENDTLGFQCDATNAVSVSETFVIEYDDIVNGGTTQSALVTVNCTISDTQPQYESDPVPGTTISLSAQFGTQAGPDGVDVRNANTNNQADSLIINSAGANDPIFNVSVVTSTFPPNGSFDGSNDVQVTCTPQGVGTVSGTLTVDTNDPNQPAGGFTYPVNCIGTGSVITSTPAAGGTLNLGSVAPGSTSPQQPIQFTNNDLDDTYSVSCSVSDPDGVFTWTPDPIQFTVSPGQTESVFFQGTPPDIATYNATVDCTANVAARGQSAFSAQYTVTVTGRPLVIPTLNHWGLLLMSLIVLALGALAGRRLMA